MTNVEFVSRRSEAVGPPKAEQSNTLLEQWASRREKSPVPLGRGYLHLARTVTNLHGPFHAQVTPTQSVGAP